MIITNEHGIQFELEPAMNFREDGSMYETGGWFASLFYNNGSGTGVFFNSKEDALKACMEYKG